MNDKVKTLAPQILEEIKKANNILLHCHPSTDGDSVGSSLAMMHYLKLLGKNVTVIIGDDGEVPGYLKVLPGSDQILEKNYLEIDPTKFDLFIINDSSSIDRVSRLGEVKFPSNMKTIVIDHHASNTGFGDINLTLPETIATGEILVSLFNEMGVEITKVMATCLMISIYTDSGGFRFKGVTENTFDAAGKLAKINPDYHQTIFDMNNNNDPKSLISTGLVLTNIHNYFRGNVAIGEVTKQMLNSHGISAEDAGGSETSNQLISVPGWNIGITLTEKEEGVVYVSMRTRDQEKFDLSKIAVELGGGGHKAAAGAEIKKPFNEAKQLLLETIQKVYPGLGKP